MGSDCNTTKEEFLNFLYKPEAEPTNNRAERGDYDRRSSLEGVAVLEKLSEGLMHSPLSPAWLEQPSSGALKPLLKRFMLRPAPTPPPDSA